MRATFSYSTILKILPFLLLFLLLLLVILIIQLLINDFCVVVMLKDRVRIKEALKKTLKIISAHKSDIFVYVLLKMGLGICAAIIYMIISLVALLGFLLPAAAIAAGLYFVYKLTPLKLHFIYFIFLYTMLVPLLFALWYFLLSLNLPFAVFFRTLSIKFMPRLDPTYNLFRFPLEREVL